jgi:hypothetical protein
MALKYSAVHFQIFLIEHAVLSEKYCHLLDRILHIYLRLPDNLM